MPSNLHFVPHVSTARLLLREYRAQEFDAFAEDLFDPEATRFMSPVADRRTAWRNFAASQGVWLLHSAGWWAVELRETAEVVATVGAFFRETSAELEVGWRV